MEIFSRQKICVPRASWKVSLTPPSRSDHGRAEPICNSVRDPIGNRYLTTTSGKEGVPREHSSPPAHRTLMHNLQSNKNITTQGTGQWCVKLLHRAHPSAVSLDTLHPSQLPPVEDRVDKCAPHSLETTSPGGCVALKVCKE